MSSIFPIREKISLDREPEPRLVDLDDETADEVFEALSSSTTRDIFLELHSQPQTASDLAEVTDTSVQNVQYHIEKLSDVDLVEVVDTWYSERGSEMKVYAPRDESLVLFAGRDKQGAFRRLLDRFAGVFALLAPPSVLAGWLANRRDTATEEAIRGEYLTADDDADVAVDDAEDTAAADDVDEDDAVEADAVDEEDTEEPAAEEAPEPEGDEEFDTTVSTGDGETVEVAVNETYADLTTPENETVYLVPEGTEGTDILGIDPAVALAVFAGGLVIYGAFALRGRVA